MKRHVRRHCLAMTAMLIMCAMPWQPGFAAESAAKEERIPFALPTLKADTMPAVFFSHDRHVEKVEAAGGDCSSCHLDTRQGMSEYFLKTENMSAKEVIPYIHAACVDCHALAKRGTAKGPLLTSCRSCHTSTTAATVSSKTVGKK